jgi:carbonic anhydrase
VRACSELGTHLRLICSLSSQYHLDDDCANAVLSFAVNNVGVEHGMCSTHSPFNSNPPRHPHPPNTSPLPELALTPLTVIIVGHTNCGGAAACHSIASGQRAPVPTDQPLGRWLAPLTGLAKALHANEPGRDTRQAVGDLVDENVKMQVGFLVLFLIVKV